MVNNYGVFLFCRAMNWLQIITQGTITGILLTLSFGAGFFALVQTSILFSYRKGLLIALGAIISDALFIAMAVFSTTFISAELPKYESSIRIIALIAFLVLGIRTILKSSHYKNESVRTVKANYYYISKGFLLNLVNPLVLITWLGITIFLESTLHYGVEELSLYFLCVILSTFASQSAVCVFSHKIKNYLSDNFIHRMNIAIGVLFIVLGLALFFSGNQTGEGINKAKELLQ